MSNVVGIEILWSCGTKAQKTSESLSSHVLGLAQAVLLNINTSNSLSKRYGKKTTGKWFDMGGGGVFQYKDAVLPVWATPC